MPRRATGRDRGSLILAVGFTLTFGLALFVRLYDWGIPTLIAERQYRSALIARSLYFEAVGNVPEWRLTAVRSSIRREPALEPPLLEWLVSRVYLILGGESPWVPRLFSSAFWLAGGLFLLRIARRFAPPLVALILTGYYLLLPIGVHVSVSFLPDPLMIMLFLASLLAMLRYFESRTAARLVAASLVSAFAVAVKPLCLFAILGAFAGLAIHSRRQRGRLVDGHLMIFLVTVFVLGTAYYVNGMLLDDYMSTQAQNSFVPRALLHRGFLIYWLLNAAWGVGYVPLILGLLGVGTHGGMNRALVLGLWAGYVVFCLVFAYHVQITPHYHLQLVPVVALSAAPLVTTLFERVKRTHRSWLMSTAAAGLLLAVLLTLVEVRYDFAARRFESPDVAREIGELVDHNTRVVFVSAYYGVPLEYFGEIAGEDWPRRLRHWAFREQGEGSRTVVERLETLQEVPEYFVITDFAEFDKHHRDLAAFLDSECRPLSKSEHYLVYDTRACVRRALETAGRRTRRLRARRILRRAA